MNTDMFPDRTKSSGFYRMKKVDMCSYLHRIHSTNWMWNQKTTQRAYIEVIVVFEVHDSCHLQSRMDIDDIVSREWIGFMRFLWQRFLRNSISFYEKRIFQSGGCITDRERGLQTTFTQVNVTPYFFADAKLSFEVSGIIGSSHSFRYNLYSVHIVFKILGQIMNSCYWNTLKQGQ